MTIDEIETLLPYIEQADEVVIEEWKTRPKQARAGVFDWNKMVAPEAIGALKLLCRQVRTPFVFQQPAQRVPGYGFAGMKYVAGSKKQGVHWRDALAHFAYRTVTHYKLPPSVFSAKK